MCITLLRMNSPSLRVTHINPRATRQHLKIPTPKQHDPTSTYCSLLASIFPTVNTSQTTAKFTTIDMIPIYLDTKIKLRVYMDANFYFPQKLSKIINWIMVSLSRGTFIWNFAKVYMYSLKQVNWHGRNNSFWISKRLYYCILQYIFIIFVLNKNNITNSYTIISAIY